jgi:uncharacterized protein with HEPN domain
VKVDRPYLEHIAEAANRLSPETRDTLPMWREAAGFRNRLIHAYWLVDLGLVWETIQIDLPKLKHEVEHLLRSSH